MFSAIEMLGIDRSQKWKRSNDMLGQVIMYHIEPDRRSRCADPLNLRPCAVGGTAPVFC
jgi:hypothetical protein